MWICPKCEREFKNTNQSHFCGKGTSTVDAYIEEQSEFVQPMLIELRDALREALPEAKEQIAWQMPTYTTSHHIIHFASFKNHVSIYPGDQAIIHFAEQLSPYKTSKGAVQFPHTINLPIDLIIEIASWCYKTGQHH